MTVHEFLYDSLRKRKLYRSGVSSMTLDDYIDACFQDSARKAQLEELLNAGLLVLEDTEEKENFELMTDQKLGFRLEEVDSVFIYPTMEPTENHILDLIDQDRLEQALDKHGANKIDERLALEVRFFTQSTAYGILAEAVDIIMALKSKNIPWGVGRGSSCASFLLYLIGIHDIDCIEYKIPFSELSKEYKTDYED